jgi:hypothetical protein
MMNTSITIRANASSSNGVDTSYQYDALSHLLGVQHGTIDGAKYTAYDAANNRLSKQNLLSNVTEKYCYDALYQLTQVLQGALVVTFSRRVQMTRRLGCKNRLAQRVAPELTLFQLWGLSVRDEKHAAVPMVMMQTEHDYDTTVYSSHQILRPYSE